MGKEFNAPLSEKVIKMLVRILKLWTEKLITYISRFSKFSESVFKVSQGSLFWTVTFNKIMGQGLGKKYKSIKIKVIFAPIPSTE